MGREESLMDTGSSRKRIAVAVSSYSLFLGVPISYIYMPSVDVVAVVISVLCFFGLLGYY
jgi:hypothetical protein